MADSLDDFFAKKDKKRGKQKSVLSAEALVRELEEGAKQVEYSVRKDKTSAAIEILGLDADDGDWRDFEDVEKRDYTGLKVKEMSLQDQNDADNKRLTSDQTDFVPDSVAWKIKDQQEPTSSPLPTASSSTDPNFSKQQTQSMGSQDSKAKIASDTDLASKSDSKTDPKDSLASTEAQGIKEAVSTSSTDKDGDKGAADQSKAVYVPRQMRGRVQNDVRVLEPIRLGKAKSSHIGYGASKIDIQDESAFPSLG